MPTYKCRNKETGEVTEEFMKISELDAFREANPHLETVIGAPAICDPVRIGVTKKDTGFKEVLQKINERVPGGMKESGSSQL